MEEFSKLQACIVGLASDVTKAGRGNKSAAVRVRVGMQTVKQLAQDVRVAMSKVS